MDSSSSNLRAIIEPVMQAVTAVMEPNQDPNGPFDPMETKIGVEEITSQDETPQVYWTPLEDDGYHFADEQPDDGHALFDTWTLCEVKCWGSDLGEAERLRNAVLVKSHNIYSGAAIKPVGPVAA